MSQENDSPDQPSAEAGGAPASFKVELDIDDAPFLEEPEEEKEPEKPVEEEKKPELPAAPKEKPESLGDKIKALLKDKKFLAIVGGAFVLLIVVPLVLFVVLPDKEDAPPAPVEPEIVIPEPRVIQLGPQEPQDAPAPKFVYALEPFFVERRGTEGEIRFLHCKFSIPTDDQTLYSEMMIKKIALRDAIYYYLVNAKAPFLPGESGAAVLRQDVMTIINENISSGKIADMYVEEFLITGK